MSTAVISDCGRYRYWLSRDLARPDLFDQAPERASTVLFVMLNPSTADATSDDPTIRRCIGFTRAWGFERLTVANLFAYRATKPSDLAMSHRTGVDIIGPDNNLAADVIMADLVIVAWGSAVEKLGTIGRRRAGQVTDLCNTLDKPPMHLGMTKTGHPRHPLYVKADTRPSILEATS